MNSVQVSGLKEVTGMLRRLEDKTRKQFVRKAGREALKPALEAARAAAPNESGRTKKGLRITSAKGLPGMVRMVMGLRKSRFKADPKKKGAFYPAHVERGHAVGRRTRRLRQEYSGGKYIGARKFVKGKFWMRRVFVATRQRVLTTFVASIYRQIAAEQRRAVA